MKRRIVRLALLGAALIALTGCTSAPTEPAGPDPRPAPEPEVVDITLPECEDANPLASFHQRALETIYDELTVTQGEMPLSRWLEYMDSPKQSFAEPVPKPIIGALTKASETRICRWPVSAHALTTQVTAQLSGDDQAKLIESLEQAQDTVETDRAGLRVFTHKPVPEAGEEPPYGVTITRHVFVQDLWIMTMDTLGADYLASGLERVFETNPDLQPTGFEAGSCRAFDARSALALGGAQLPPFFEDAAPGEPGSWDLSGENLSADTYDACAPLSWITVPIHGGTASSPYAILLFTEGEFAGTATPEPQGFYPEVSRENDETITIAYKHRLGDETTAEASGKRVMTVHWDAAAGELSRSPIPPVE